MLTVVKCLSVIIIGAFAQNVCRGIVRRRGKKSTMTQGGRHLLKPRNTHAQFVVNQQTTAQYDVTNATIAKCVLGICPLIPILRTVGL